MNIYQTALTQNTPIPRQLDYLKASSRRHLLATAKEKKLLFSLEKGAIGEQTMIDYLQQYGQSHWTVIQNLWMDHFGLYETDLTVLTNHANYVLEIKNYEGQFEYKDSRCFIDGRKQRENPIHQAEKSFMNAQDICRHISPHLTVKGAIIFIGQHNQVDIQSQVDGIQVITKAGLPRFIQAIANEESAFPYQPLSHQHIIPHFEKREVLNPYGPTASYHPEEVLAGRRGIYCRECFQFDLTSTRLFVKCKCGFVENRREAIVRTIHEYGVLTFDHDFMYRSDLSAFMDGQVGDKLLIEILNDQFSPNKNGRYTSYPNKKRFLTI